MNIVKSTSLLVSQRKPGHISGKQEVMVRSQTLVFLRINLDKR